MSRQTDNIIQVVSPTDKAIFKIAEELLREKIIDRFQFFDAPYSNNTANNLGELKALISEFGSFTGRTINKAYFTKQPGISCEFDRGVTVGNQSRPSLYEAEFFFRPLNSPDPETSRIIARLIHKYCNTKSLNIGLGSAQVSSAIANHVESLSAVAAGVASQLSEAQIEYDNRLQSHQERLTTYFEAQEAERVKKHEAELAVILERVSCCRFCGRQLKLP
ncbi:MAG: hypothetical protein AAF296_10690 [Pseudomonadota bacterium]